jgi:glucose uptake protein GlcU
VGLVEFVEGEREVLGVERLLDVVVLGAKTVITRVELGGTLLLAAVIGVLLTSRDEKDESSPS